MSKSTTPSDTGLGSRLISSLTCFGILLLAIEILNVFSLGVLIGLFVWLAIAVATGLHAADLRARFGTGSERPAEISTRGVITKLIARPVYGLGLFALVFAILTGLHLAMHPDSTLLRSAANSFAMSLFFLALLGGGLVLLYAFVASSWSETVLGPVFHSADILACGLSNTDRRAGWLRRIQQADLWLGRCLTLGELTIPARGWDLYAPQQNEGSPEGHSHKPNSAD